MKKHFNRNDTIYQITKQHPDIIDILANLGFSEITKPGMLSTVGRVMTLSKGAMMRGIDLEEIYRTLEAAGYEILD